MTSALLFLVFVWLAVLTAYVLYLPTEPRHIDIDAAVKAHLEQRVGEVRQRVATKGRELLRARLAAKRSGSQVS